MIGVRLRKWSPSLLPMKMALPNEKMALPHEKMALPHEKMALPHEWKGYDLGDVGPLAHSFRRELIS
jgi:hypothetical protein